MRGAHMVFLKRGAPNNLSIPNHREMKDGLLHQLIKDMGLTIDKFLALARK